ncbi:MAG: hypothetical protein J3K34DRAFT_193358 [Monoraphidium minutum]|nr:MAG: hypothetical protein J3K34DRAFT_193358 [Monoraphidium minutum]
MQGCAWEGAQASMLGGVCRIKVTGSTTEQPKSKESRRKDRASSTTRAGAYARQGALWGAAAPGRAAPRGTAAAGGPGAAAGTALFVLPVLFGGSGRLREGHECGKSRERAPKLHSPGKRGPPGKERLAVARGAPQGVRRRRALGALRGRGRCEREAPSLLARGRSIRCFCKREQRGARGAAGGRRRCAGRVLRGRQRARERLGAVGLGAGGVGRGPHLRPCRCAKGIRKCRRRRGTLVRGRHRRRRPALFAAPQRATRGRVMPRAVGCKPIGLRPRARCVCACGGGGVGGRGEMHRAQPCAKSEARPRERHGHGCERLLFVGRRLIWLASGGAGGRWGWAGGRAPACLS